MKIPNHIALICDGNGRWAKKRFLPRYFGHINGAKKIKEVINYALKYDIKNLTFYIFSTENWKRPLEEVQILFNLFENYIKKSKDFLMNNDIKLNIIGEKENIKNYISLIDEIENLTKNNQKLNVNIAFNYGSRSEITNTVNKLIKEGKKEITEEDISNNLYISEDVDLLIRTSGEHRISNFLLWQLAYSELYFSNIFWPDFNEEEFINALNFYNKKERRFGGIYVK